jgi:6-O-methylguanine DNA methyltransferase, DNA binding domain
MLSKKKIDKMIYCQYMDSPIVIPCHRVIGSNGKPTGFGGGIPIKQALLDLEQRYR